MPATIKIDNFGSINIKEISQVDVEALAAQAVVALKSTQGLAVSDFCIIGQRGTERAELRRILSIADPNITLTANLLYRHSKFEPFASLYGDKIKLYRAANVNGTQPADGSFAAVGSVVDIDPDQMATSVTDSTGSDQFWYKFTYYNSVALSETSLADSSAARGGSADTYCSIDEIRAEAGISNNQYITDADVTTQRSAAQDRINSALSGIYTVPFTAPISPLIQKITVLLAAGYILKREYGVTSSINNQRGQMKINEAEGYLTRLDTKDLILTDTTGTDTSIPGSASGVTGWPNADTTNAEDADGGDDGFGFTRRTRY